MGKEKGITLVALVITIIVMLILSAVTINLTLGERGIFNTATSAVEKQKIAEYLEKIELSRVEVSSYNMGKVTIDDLKAQILKDKIVIPPSEGTITKVDEEKLNMTTKEGYIFFIYVETAEYIGKYGEIPTPPEIKEGDVEVVVSPEGWANQNKKVTMTHKLGENYTIQYSLDNGATWKDYTSNFEIYKDTQIWVCLRNALGIQGTYATYKVDKIDREAPIITNVTSNPTSITFSAKDEASGIVGYKVTTTTEEPTEFEIITNTKEITNQTVNVANQNTTYYVWVKDEAGNVSAYSTAKTTTQAVTKINVTPESATIKMNETVQLTANVLPSNAFNKTITWSSANTNIATVNSDGVVTPVSGGSTTIMATSTYGENRQTVLGSCTITVQKAIASIGDVKYSSITDAINATQVSSTITLLEDQTEEITILEGKEITLNLNGKTLSDNGNVITNKGKLILTGNGIISSRHVEGDGIAVYNKGDFILESGIIKNTEGWTLQNLGTFTMNGGKIENYSPSNGATIMNVGEFYMNGGTIYGTRNAFVTDGGKSLIDGDNIIISSDINAVTTRGAGKDILINATIKGKIACNASETDISVLLLMKCNIEEVVAIGTERGYVIEVIGTSVGYDIYVYDSNKELTDVRCPTWTRYNEQDDVIWGKATATNRKNVKAWYYSVNKMDHNNESGRYATHIYNAQDGITPDMFISGFDYEVK